MYDERKFNEFIDEFLTLLICLNTISYFRLRFEEFRQICSYLEKL